LTDPPHEQKAGKISFSVASISCVACTPAFKKGLERIEGIENVSQLPMLNKIVVEFEPAKIDEAKVKEEIFNIAEKVGFSGKIIISR
jgi:copper chaperone CopZ